MSLSIPDRIMKQKMALCIDEPFFGVLLMRLKVQEVAPGAMACDTMATDGTNLFYCAPYVDKLTNVQLKGLLAHEVMHNAMLHHTRRGHRDPTRWNQAADASIDHVLKDAGFDVPDSFADQPEWAWARGLAAETIYHDMPAKSQSDLRGNHPPPPPKGGPGAPGDGKPRPGMVVDTPSSSPATEEGEMKIALKQAAMSQASYDRRKGRESGWLKGFIDAACAPKVRWQDVLRRFFAPFTPCDYSFARPNRRYIHQGLYLPGVIKEGIGEGVVYFDSSGSCVQDWPQFRGELEAIFNEVLPERVHVVMCDSAVKDIQTYEQGEEFRPDVSGGGGSDFRPAFKAVATMAVRPQWAVVLSDMLIDFPNDAPPYPVIAVSTTTHTGPEWAECIAMDR